MNTFPTVALSALLIAVLPLQAGSCQPEEPPTCERVDLRLEMSTDTPTILLTNNNSSTIRFHMDVKGSQCSSSDCPIIVSIDKSLEAGETGIFTLPSGPYCDDVFCCAEGWTGWLDVVYTMDGSGCQLTASAVRESCDGT